MKLPDVGQKTNPIGRLPVAEWVLGEKGEQV